MMKKKKKKELNISALCSWRACNTFNQNFYLDFELISVNLRKLLAQARKKKKKKQECKEVDDNKKPLQQKKND